AAPPAPPPGTFAGMRPSQGMSETSFFLGDAMKTAEPARPLPPIHKTLAVLVMGMAALWFSCAVHRRAGTGDVAFRLLWDGVSDLDLFVEDPAGGCIYFAHPGSDAGGILDIDCNSGTQCAHPIENVYWPAGSAPEGTYTYWIYANSLLGSETPLPFEVQVLRGPTVALRHQGTIQEVGGKFGPLDYEFSRERNAAPLKSERPLPACAVWME